MALREKQPSWGPKKLLDVLGRRNPERALPSIPTAARMLDRASGRRMPKRIETYDYPPHFLVRRVSRAGTIRAFRNQILVSNTLREDDVGLEQVAGCVYDLCFCFYQIGRYDLKRNKIQGVVSKVGLSANRVDIVSLM